MRILNFGSCNIDHVYTVDRIVVPGETVAASSVQTHPGGKGLNQAVALARAGAEVFYAGCIGEDGEYLYRFMKESGVDLTYTKRVEGESGQAFIQVDSNGDNSIVTFRGANHKVTPDYIDSVLDHFEAGDVLLLQNEISEMEYLVDKAYQAGMRIVLNPSPFDARIGQVDLNKITFLLLNEGEAAGYADTANLEEFIATMRSRFPKLSTVLTRGGKGCIYFDAEKVFMHPAFEVKTVDATAAGATFIGYFVANICKGKTVEVSVRYACAAAAMAVSKEGAASSIPFYQEVRRQIGELKPYSYNKRDHMVNAVNAYLRKNYVEATLEGLSKDLGYSNSYTIRWLKKNMGATFSELVIEYRCRAAAELLRTTDYSVSDIIDMVGYKNESFFRKIFAEKYGMTPLQYRKRGE